ncbi:MAG: FtsW/RodA/SpoVE family cell cycle protein [Fimbriimonadaceae bacterium]|nr:FtsW/RodA/SpoVE family cell cycle protein [Fimbriimonadaceae bacterium]QYK59507.1 MAG: FtsW/RodA/SpoVE family cell cycle protein [Fimbriimonadaceae bacterium]
MDRFESAIEKARPFDPILFLLALAATLVGIVAIWDSGYARAAAVGQVVPREVLSQFFATIAAVFVGGLCWLVRGDFWKRAGALLFVLGIVGLALVKVFGKEVNGAQRWIDLGPFMFQPSEFVKAATVVYLAGVFADRKPLAALKRRPRHWGEALDHVWVPRLRRAWPLLVVGLAVVMIEMEPDLATAMVVAAIAGVMFFLGGVSGKSLAMLAGGLVVVAGWMVVTEPYRMERILNHGDRWAAGNVGSIGYQTTQSEAAMAQGGLLGVGLGQGRAKHTLPAPTTDFVMTTVAEETGFLGTVVVLGLVGGVSWRLLWLSRRGPTRHSRLVLGGAAAWVGVQACTNIVMGNGTAPPIGVPMPFVSAGGSSLVALWALLGICQSVLSVKGKEEETVEVGRDRWRYRRTRLSRA